MCLPNVYPFGCDSVKGGHGVFAAVRLPDGLDVLCMWTTEAARPKMLRVSLATTI